jgi:Asp-tRNA(Asn)/Glu-tRNA(Gln) amidotransferase B subunit
MYRTGGDPQVIVAEEGLSQISDTVKLENVVVQVLESNPDKVEAYRNGKTGLLGFFMGQVMKETDGQANPQVVNEMLRSKLASAQ